MGFTECWFWPRKSFCNHQLHLVIECVAACMSCHVTRTTKLHICTATQSFCRTTRLTICFLWSSGRVRLASPRISSHSTDFGGTFGLCSDAHARSDRCPRQHFSFTRAFLLGRGVSSLHSMRQQTAMLCYAFHKAQTNPHIISLFSGLRETEPRTLGTILASARQNSSISHCLLLSSRK